MTETNDPNHQLDIGLARLTDDATQPVKPAQRVPLLPEPSGWTDALTGTDGPRYWDRLVSGEQARVRRHGPSATVVMLELHGFEEAATRIGAAAALQKFAQISRALASLVRSSDHIARVGPSRFGLVLVETNELEALNFIDRTLAHLRAAIASENLDVRIGVGWASPAPGASLSQAIATAEQRLATDFFHTR